MAHYSRHGQDEDEMALCVMLAMALGRDPGEAEQKDAKFSSQRLNQTTISSG